MLTSRKRNNTIETNTPTDSPSLLEDGVKVPVQTETEVSPVSTHIKI